MGWDGIQVQFGKSDRQAIKEFLKSEFSWTTRDGDSWEALEVSLHSGVAYLMVQKNRKELHLFTVLIRWYGSSILLKDIGSIPPAGSIPSKTLPISYVQRVLESDAKHGGTLSDYERAALKEYLASRKEGKELERKLQHGAMAAIPASRFGGDESDSLIVQLAKYQVQSKSDPHSMRTRSRWFVVHSYCPDHVGCAVPSKLAREFFLNDEGQRRLKEWKAAQGK